MPAAVAGRVETLIVDPDAPVAGVYSAAESRAIVATGGNANTVDLIDFAVAKTLATGGAVFSLPRAADFPGLAATLRCL